MLETIGAILILVIGFAIRVVLSPSFNRAVDRSLAEETQGNLANNLDIYDQMKAAKARGEDFTPSNYR